MKNVVVSRFLSAVFGRFAVMVSALSSCFLAPSGFAQLSSSAENHADFDALVQDQYPNQGGYNRQLQLPP